MKIKNILSLLSFVIGLFTFVVASLFFITGGLDDLSLVLSLGSVIGLCCGIAAGLAKQDENTEKPTKLLSTAGIMLNISGSIIILLATSIIR